MPSGSWRLKPKMTVPPHKRNFYGVRLDSLLKNSEDESQRNSLARFGQMNDQESNIRAKRYVKIA
jgi:hypothetical protein